MSNTPLSTHRFYSKSKSEQQRIQWAIALVALLLNLLVLTFAVYTEWYFLSVIFIALSLSVIAPFFDVPALYKSSQLTYYSPLFLAEREKNGRICIHGGSLFDYLFVIDRNLNGRQRTNFIIKQYLQGLINLIESRKLENTKDLKVRGTSYIINQRTAEKLGFQKLDTDFLQKIILSYNYLNICLSASMAKAKPSFPKLSAVQTFEAHFSDLAKRKAFIEEMYRRLD